MADGQIVFEVTADGKRAIADIKDITRAIEQETKKWDTAAEQSTEDMGNSFNSMLKKIVGGFSVAKIGQMLLQFGKDALQAASDLQEVQNVVDTTFGDNSSQIDRWAKNAIQQFGLTETQAKKYASTIGAMMKSSGLAGDEIIGMSENLAGLAADMASFYNLDFDEAFQKIRSGISGETEPLKQLGINMSVANLNAFALQQGLSKTFEQMSQGEQTMLRYQYMMSATADAQGDFARTSSDYANSQRLLQSNIETLKTKLGELFTGPMAQITGWITETLVKLTTPAETTVLDDFKAIDLDTGSKLKQITEIAEQARELTEQLDAIGGEKTDKIGGKVQQLVNDLSGIDLNQDKLGIVKEFTSTLASNIGVLSAVTGEDAQGLSDWLNSVGSAAESLKPDDAEGWASLITSIKEKLPGIEDTDFGQAFFSALGGEFETITSQSKLFEWVLENLGDKTSKTAQEQELWLETCRRLVQTIPGLSSIINTETGEIKGGTDAVREYIKAWEDGKTRIAMLQNIEQKEAALASKYAEMTGYELEAALARRRAKKAREAWESSSEYIPNIDAIIEAYEMEGENTIPLPKLYTAWQEAEKAAKEAEQTFKDQKEALEEAEIALQEYRETVDEEYPESVQNAIDITEEWSDELKTKAKAAVTGLSEAILALDDYVKGAHESMRKNVDSIVKGFEKMGKAGDDYRKESADLAAQEADVLSEYADVFARLGSDNNSLKEMEKNWDNLTDREKDAHEALVKVRNAQKEVNDELSQYKPEAMKSGLQSQIDYMDEYLANLEAAQAMGLSNELLASLSDGSAESAEYLAGLVSGGETAAKEVDALYQKVAAKKAQFSQALANQQLTVDETYNDLVEKARKAIEALDLQDEAQDMTGKTVQGIAQGIADHVDDVKTAVDAIIAQIDRLSGVGINISWDGFGSIGGGGGNISNIGMESPYAEYVDGEFAIGTDWIPRDNYIARLHEGEAVLTAEENKIWQGFKAGGLDYDQLGGVVRDNVKPGGNVYLDGRIVGSVISEQQGKAYRQLQRSGWQG